MAPTPTFIAAICLKRSKPTIFRNGISAFSCSMNSKRQALTSTCSTRPKLVPKNSCHWRLSEDGAQPQPG